MPAVGYGVRIIGGHFARLWNVGVNAVCLYVIGAAGGNMGEMADYLLEQADADVDGVREAPRKTGGSKRHIHQQPQHKICPSCGQKLCIGEREECRRWCCEASWGTGKLRASAA